MAGSYQVPEHEWTPRTTWVLVALVAAACASLAVFVHPYYEASETTNDASIYIACAKSLLAGEGYAYLGAPFTIRPPGFSLLIAPVIAWRGLDFAALHTLVSLFGVATIALLFVWLHPRLGTWVSLAVAIAVWLNPTFRQMCNQVMSDVPGAAFLFACLLVERWADRERSLRRDVVLGVAIAIAAYVRSVNVLLVPAILCARIAQHRGGGWAGFARARVLGLVAGTALVLAPWSIRDALSRGTPPADQNFLYSYSTAMWHVDGGDPSSPRRSISEIVGRIPERAPKIASALGSRMETSAGSGIDIALGAIGLVALVVVLVRRRSSGEFFALGVTLVLALYFAFQGRLVLPVWLFALPAVFDVFTRRARIVAPVALAVLVCVDWAPFRGWDRIEALHRQYVRMASDYRQRFAHDARVATSIGWHSAVYLDRPVYSLLFAVRRANDVRAVEPVIDKYGINTVILWSAIPADQALIPYFEENYEGEVTASGGHFFRVR